MSQARHSTWIMIRTRPVLMNIAAMVSGLIPLLFAGGAGAGQTRVSRLIKGKVGDFSLDMLLTLAARAGLHPELRLSAR